MLNIQGNRRIYSFEEVQTLVRNMGYSIIKESFVNFTKKFAAENQLGYRFLMNDDNVRKNKHPMPFAKDNPFTIENIKNYLRINGIFTECLSEEYSGNTVKMLWKCECGNKFERSWANFYAGAILCPECSRRIRYAKSNVNYDEIQTVITSRGYTLIDKLDDLHISKDRITICDDSGYYYEINWYDFKNGKNPLAFHHGNPYSVRNINTFFRIELNGEFDCISDRYIDNMTPLDYVHKCCGAIFSDPWSYLKRLKGNPETAYCKCPKCNTTKIESHHASALKQVFLNKHPDTVVEDKSCVNPNTMHTLPTDIVNHRMKIAIEIQSSTHDSESQKSKDAIKKEYWIKNGYEFHDPDIRNYTILELIQLFFPEIDVIPKYVDYNYSNCIDFMKVQELIDSGLTIKEAAKELNENENSIRHLSFDNKITLPCDYCSKVFNMRSIVQLSKDGNFIKRYDSLASIRKNGFADGTIRRVLNGTQNYSYDSFWLYEDRYISGNYSLPETSIDKFLTPVIKYDMNGNHIATYSSIYEAETHSKSSKSEIFRVANGDRKSSRNEKWRFYKP